MSSGPQSREAPGPLKNLGCERLIHCEWLRRRLGMEALEGEADQASPKQKQIFSGMLPMAMAHILGLL